LYLFPHDGTWRAAASPMIDQASLLLASARNIDPVSTGTNINSR
jgi:hypothetical protein